MKRVFACLLIGIGVSCVVFAQEKPKSVLTGKPVILPEYGEEITTPPKSVPEMGIEKEGKWGSDVIITSITVTSPNGGENCIAGITYNITWTSQNVSGNVKIELYKGGSYNGTITSDAANDGSYSVNIPSIQTPGTDYKVKISSVNDPSIYDFSDGNFTIMHQIKVTSPNSGEIWYVGTTKTIAWEASGIGGNVKIEYSTNGGSTWNSVTSSTSDDGSYSWNIPNSIPYTTQGKIKVTHLTYSFNYDESDLTFTFYNGVEEVLSNRKRFYLYPNSPNPVYNATRISFEISKNTSVRLGIYKLTGENIRTLMDDEIEAGQHQVIWDGRDNNGKEIGAGIYFYRLEAGEFKATRKLTILR